MPETRIKVIHRSEYSIFLDCLRLARQDAHLTQVELADKLGTDQSYISKYERGERRIDVIELRAICAVVGVKLTDFVTNFEERLKSEGLS